MMRCRRCERGLERPGDHCLRCGTSNTDVVVLDVGPTAATITMLREDVVLGETTVSTIADEAEALASVHRRNYAGRIIDELHRKRAPTVYATGERSIIGRVRAQVAAEWFRVDAADPVAYVTEGGDHGELAVVDRPPREKLGGRHTTLIGGRRGRAVIQLIAEHPHVKKIIPGPIDASGGGSQVTLRAKVTRPDHNGNLRFILGDGTSVQENRIVTTASDRSSGERVRMDLNTGIAALLD
jgi:Predicted metal-binding protein